MTVEFIEQIWYKFKKKMKYYLRADSLIDNVVAFTTDQKKIKKNGFSKLDYAQVNFLS